MKVEFFPAAENELSEAAEYYEAKVRGLGIDLILEVERIAAVLIEIPCWARNSIPCIGAFHFVGFRTESSSGAMEMSFVSLRSRTGAANRVTGHLVSRIGSEI